MSFPGAPVLLPASAAVDDRGVLTHANDLDLRGFRRAYLVTNHVAGRVRAWHGHKNEAKAIWPVTGAALVGLVKIDDWTRPSRELAVQRFVLSALSPSILFVPAGYANGFMSLTTDAKLLFFSTGTVDESKNDDFRFDARYWDPWHVEDR